MLWILKDHSKKCIFKCTAMQKGMGWGTNIRSGCWGSWNSGFGFALRPLGWIFQSYLYVWGHVREIRAALRQLDALCFRSLPTLFIPVGFGLPISPGWVGMLGKLHRGIWAGWGQRWELQQGQLVSSQVLVLFQWVLNDFWPGMWC